MLLRSLKETDKFSASILKSLKGRNIILLSGDLGSGKTAFVQFLAKRLGVTRRVVSPTFMVCRTYRTHKNIYGFNRLIHCDFYRMGSYEDILGLGFWEYAEDPSNLVVVEWPHLLNGKVDRKKVLEVKFEHEGNEGRKVTVSTYDN